MKGNQACTKSNFFFDCIQIAIRKLHTGNTQLPFCIDNECEFFPKREETCGEFLEKINFNSALRSKNECMFRKKQS